MKGKVPEETTRNEDVRAINRSPVASKDRREVRAQFYITGARPAIVTGTSLLELDS